MIIQKTLQTKGQYCIGLGKDYDGMGMAPVFSSFMYSAVDDFLCIPPRLLSALSRYLFHSVSEMQKSAVCRFGYVQRMPAAHAVKKKNQQRIFFHCLIH